MTSAADSRYSGQDPEAIARQIAAARRRLEDTLDELTTRLSPSRLLTRAVGVGRIGVGQSYRHLRHAARDHPTSLVVTVAGVVGLAIASRYAVRGFAMLIRLRRHHAAVRS
jgi:hypothetical protein